jgi:hypothetical protein
MEKTYRLIATRPYRDINDRPREFTLIHEVVAPKEEAIAELKKELDLWLSYFKTKQILTDVSIVEVIEHYDILSSEKDEQWQ